MPGLAELPTSFAESTLLRWLFLVYLLFILCGSFIPFRFSVDPEFVRSQFVRFFTPPYDHGARRFSLPDVVSNVLLCIPFGFLWVGGEFYLRMQLVLWRRATSRAFRPGKKLFLLGPLGFLIAAGNRDGSPRKQQALAATAGLLVGLILEAGQIALQSRNPSLTDVLLFGGAAWAGAAVFERYRRIRIPRT
jgi:glycopeptide antibiotics resistance protein